MLTKSGPDEVQDFLTDASYIRDGYADRVVLPETTAEVAQVLAAANQEKTPVTVSGAGTGTVGGRVAHGGVVLATDRLNHIKSVEHERQGGGIAVVEAGVILSDLQRAVDREGLFYPPDPTERGCFLGGTVATNASGARTFKYGPTRNYVRRLKVVLASGEVLELRRGGLRADDAGRIEIPLSSGKVIEAELPGYVMPATRKNASGYFVAPGMDVLDLFIGSEGTLGVIVEVELQLLVKPEGLLSGVVFFAAQSDVLAFVADARSQSLQTRKARQDGSLDARALEYFDTQSLGFLRQKYPSIPETAVAAVFFEQETGPTNEDQELSVWMDLLERHHALADSWFASNEQDQARLREFRHQLPVLMNEWFSHYKQRKVSTDMAVPDDQFAGLFKFYEETLRSSELRYTIFGHIGDNHVHVNILPRNEAEGARARELYVQFLKYAARVGGTLSAEHGVGKLKRDYLRLFYSDAHLREMAALKCAFDPNGILGRGNIFSEELISG
ncbi:MAG TPA: FAD-binding oxidoreductase [Pyrinomonadaceae bacterium]|nr:FAD-binding oxidoreductase [Pyrinomonadaceae bacterium]